MLSDRVFGQWSFPGGFSTDFPLAVFGGTPRTRRGILEVPFPHNLNRLPTCGQANLLKTRWVLPSLIDSSFWIYFIIREFVNNTLGFEVAPFGKYSCHHPMETSVTCSVLTVCLSVYVAWSHVFWFFLEGLECAESIQECFKKNRWQSLNILLKPSPVTAWTH